MSSWIVIANAKYYDLDRFVEERQIIDWQQRSIRYSVGDIVYFYCTAPDKRIKYGGRVIQTGLNEHELEDDSKYWINREAYNRGNTSWIRVQINSFSDPNSLSLNDLRKNGYTASPQSPSRVSEQLSSYIDGHMNSIEGLYPDSEELEGQIVEGAIKKVTVNAYERNPIARMKCIEHYGCKCAVCGIDFGDYYGDFASGFIHVHHIKPIHEIKQEYVVNPLTDLIPVCPNCHAVLHMKTKDGKQYSVEELRQIIGSRR